MNALALWICAAPQAPVAPPASAPFEVAVVREDGEFLCSITARGAPLGRVLRDLAGCAGLDLAGLDGEAAARRVDVELERRPLADAAAILAGCADRGAEVRARAIVIAEPGAVTAVDSALGAYFAALRAFPAHALAPAAMREEARIEERRGRLTAARGHYEALLERHPRSSVAPQARLELARMSMRESRFDLASLELSDLLRYGAEPELEATARLELARCTVEVGEPARALYMVDALDSSAPGADPVGRDLVRARCLASLGRGREALAALERVELACEPAERRAERTELRARACEAAGLFADASRAWLALASIADETARPRALAEAARTALAGGDELATLFIARRAEGEGASSPAVEESARLARTRLGLAGSLERPTIEEQLAWARALANGRDTEAALALLREQIECSISEDVRRSLYVVAGKILESAGEIERAIAAYEGKL